MPFTDIQIKALSNKLSVKHVRTRQSAGKTLSYIEGWHAIAEANRIFGYDAWDRQTMTIKCVWEGIWRNKAACSYVTRVRVRVRAGDVEICREGCGSGHGTGLTPGEAHEKAIKEAETDAMKRALTTFGNPFGLALYDKKQHHVTGRKQRQSQNGKDQAMTWLVLSSEGEYLSAHEHPVDYCTSMRQLLEAISTRERLRDFWQRNSVIIAMLRRNLPDLKTDKGEHYADILISLYKQQMRLVSEEQKAHEQKAAELASRRFEAGSQNQAAASASEAQVNKQGPEKREVKGQQPSVPATAGNGHIDKTNLPISTPRRIRDKEHLRYVASQPCIICGRLPAQAHHLRFAQPRALGRKVSDEWTVPLCASHHQGLHSVGDEEDWWRENGIDPTVLALRLWWDTKHKGEGPKRTMIQSCNTDTNRPPNVSKQVAPLRKTAKHTKEAAPGD